MFQKVEHERKFQSFYDNYKIISFGETTNQNEI